MSNTEFNLNQGQKDAAEAFFQFLFSDEPAFILDGRAGTGKTYWMGYIIDIIMPRYHEACKLVGIDPQYDSVTMTAFTNKAAEVLEAATGRTTQTIHSFLNLTLFEDYETGRSTLKKNPKTWVVHERKIIFLDECSMVDNPVFKIIAEGTHQCKIVYVGDRRQLAPVMDKISPVYRQNYPMAELTQQMRNNNRPDLMALCEQLRDTVETGIFNPIHEVPGIIDWLDDTTMQQMLAQTFTQQTKESRVLAYTNGRVIEYNDYIRQMRGLPVNFQSGEIVLAAAATKIGRNKLISVESEVTIRKNNGSGQEEIEKGVMLDVDYLDFTSHLGEYFNHVPVPTDKSHFDRLVKHYKSQKNWERFYYLKQNFPDFRPRDAATIHKSQGSTYESVFIDLDTIAKCHDKDMAARLLYVAFSRARMHVFLYGNLVEKYGGIVAA